MYIAHVPIVPIVHWYVLGTYSYMVNV